jgi:ATP-dependent helicase HrpA
MARGREVSESAPAGSGGARELRERLPDLMLRDAHRLGRRLETLTRGKNRGGPPDLGRLTAVVDEAWLRVAVRRESVPAVAYPEELPVAGRRGSSCRR